MGKGKKRRMHKANDKDRLKGNETGTVIEREREGEREISEEGEIGRAHV